MRPTLVLLSLISGMRGFAQPSDVVDIARQRDREPPEIQHEPPPRGSTAMLWPECSTDFDNVGKGMRGRPSQHAGVSSSWRLAQKL